MGDPLAVYIPLPGTSARHTILPGSGVVGAAYTGRWERITIDYEGNAFGSEAMARFADRVAHAAGRQTENYPTTSRMWVSDNGLQAIGYWDKTEGVVVLDSAQAALDLAAWLGTATLDPAELIASGAHYEQRRSVLAALGSGDPARIATARWYARQYHIDID